MEMALLSMVQGLLLNFALFSFPFSHKSTLISLLFCPGFARQEINRGTIEAIAKSRGGEKKIKK